MRNVLTDFFRISYGVVWHVANRRKSLARTFRGQCGQPKSKLPPSPIAVFSTGHDVNGLVRSYKYFFGRVPNVNDTAAGDRRLFACLRGRINLFRDGQLRVYRVAPFSLLNLLRPTAGHPPPPSLFPWSVNVVKRQSKKVIKSKVFFFNPKVGLRLRFSVARLFFKFLKGFQFTFNLSYTNEFRGRPAVFCPSVSGWRVISIGFLLGKLK